MFYLPGFAARPHSKLSPPVTGFYSYYGGQSIASLRSELHDRTIFFISLWAPESSCRWEYFRRPSLSKEVNLLLTTAAEIHLQCTETFHIPSNPSPPAEELITILAEPLEDTDCFLFLHLQNWYHNPNTQSCFRMPLATVHIAAHCRSCDWSSQAFKFHCINTLFSPDYLHWSSPDLTSCGRSCYGYCE